MIDVDHRTIDRCFRDVESPCGPGRAYSIDRGLASSRWRETRDYRRNRSRSVRRTRSTNGYRCRRSTIIVIKRSSTHSSLPTVLNNSYACSRVVRAFLFLFFILFFTSLICLFSVGSTGANARTVRATASSRTLHGRRYASRRGTGALAQFRPTRKRNFERGVENSSNCKSK